MTELEGRSTPGIELVEGRMRLSGEWTLRRLSPELKQIREQLGTATPGGCDMGQVTRLDNFGAQLLWRAWGGRFPDDAVIPPSLQAVFQRLAEIRLEPPPKPRREGLLMPVLAVGRASLALANHLADFVVLLGQLLLDAIFLLRHPSQMPWLEFSANLFKVGVRAMPVTALVGFLIGVVLSYLSALQLKAFGADVFIVNILGLGIVRELGPVLVSVLVAGRSGSAMTAQLGVMRVTEEIDALSTMGISRYLRLVAPKVAALTFAMPLLVLWTSAVALFGGMVSAQIQLDISYSFFIETLPRVVPLANLYIALAKGAAFGLLIALVACHFGLRVKPNTESLSANTTASVVSAITVVILVDAIFAIATRNVGVPI